MEANAKQSNYSARTARFVPKPAMSIAIQFYDKDGRSHAGYLNEISSTGLKCLMLNGTSVLRGSRVIDIKLVSPPLELSVPEAEIIRIERLVVESVPSNFRVAVLAFTNMQQTTLERLQPFLDPPPYLTGELAGDYAVGGAAEIQAEEHSALDFYRVDSADLFEKCDRFYEMIKDLQQKQLYQTMYRVTLTSGLDHRIIAFNPITKREEELICFDSNSYFSLHRHPRVIDATEKALRKVGYGTPSSQLLCGTNRYLRELEEVISDFHGREDTLVFPSGYGANSGIITGLLRKKDIVIRDRFSHTSIHDACSAADCQRNYTYPHLDFNRLEALLSEADADEGCKGKLVVSDGVFSMHGCIVPLPSLLEICRRHNAKLMLDEAHSVGVIGPNGKGVEDHFNLPGAVDILMGTFSKAPGTSGGYVTGKKELIYYLRFFARSAVFTASLPAATCAGITEAFRIITDEPEHRTQLWRNIRVFAPALKGSGFIVCEPESPIITVFIGTNQLLWAFSRDLFMSGIKCGNVSYPAVPNGEAILRFAVNSRHTDEDLNRCVEIMTGLGKKFGILNKTEDEIRKIGERMSK
ncbi:MAG: aminotransferase class I/II-fold pyridoxal phosphate-dependent enzyme [Bdellovibrionota bacterium]